MLIQGEKSFSLLKRILHYIRCTMTESRLNDHALIALHPTEIGMKIEWDVVSLYDSINENTIVDLFCIEKSC